VKSGDKVIAMDGFDLDPTRPRIRVVVEVEKEGMICRTLEGELGLLFQKDQLRLASANEVPSGTICEGWLLQ
jgi:hypothetical protein